MKKVFILFLLLTSTYVQAQSKGGAFLRSVVLPGWGHQYVNSGSWKGKATVYAATDAGLWIGLASTIMRKNRLTQSYQTLAATKAGAQIEGKDRAFFLSLAGFATSADRVQQLQWNRNWTGAEEAAKAENAWSWKTTADQELYAQTRNRAESMRRQKPMLIGLLVTNRVISGVTSVLDERRKNKKGNRTALSLDMPLGQTNVPSFNLSVRF
jgi:hypothetical protein